MKDNISIALFGSGVVGDTVLKHFAKMGKQLEYSVIDNEPDDIEALKAICYDIGILAWWPHIIKKDFIETAKIGFLNFHPSYLPYSRGKDPSFWTILDGKQAGVTIHWVDEWVDSGDIAFQKKIDVSWEDTAKTLYDKSIVGIIQLFIDNFDNIITGRIPRIKQDLDVCHTRNDMLDTAKIDLNSQYQGRYLLNLLRAKTFSDEYNGVTFKDSGKEYQAKISIKEIKPIDKILHQKPSINNFDVESVTEATLGGWGDDCNFYVSKFENKFKRFIGAKHAIATSSCTGALTLALSALGVGVGDEVILADTNWVATVAPIVNLGATPVFVDIFPDTWCINANLIESSITSKTKAIIVTHLYGNLCEMTYINYMVKKYNIPVIEDAAEAIGSTFAGAHAGNLGKIGVFSFHGSKTITTGEGGMLITKDDDIYEKALTLSNHGRSKTSEMFIPDVIGYKFKMSNMQAALGCSQLKRIDGLVHRKQEILEYYKNNLKSKHISMNPYQYGCVNGAWMPTVVFSKESGVKASDVLDKMKQNNIDARPFFKPLSSLPMFRPEPNTNAYDIYPRAINLPSYYDMTDEQQDRVINVILECL